MQSVGVEADGPDRAALDLVGAREIPLEHQPAAACDQHRVHVGARRREPIRHPAQRSAVDALVVVAGDDRPAVVARDRNAAAGGRVRGRRQRGEGCQRSATEQ